jgi:hypothetical protein
MEGIEYIKYSASPNIKAGVKCMAKAICGGGHMVEFYMVVVELQKNCGLGPGRVLTLLASSRSL